MLELYYQYPSVLKRLRGGALGKEMDRIAALLSEVGYKPASAKIYLTHIARFSRFAAEAGCGDAATIAPDVIDRFLRARETQSARIGARTAVGHALQFAADRFPAACPQQAADPDERLLGTYAEHLRHVRGLQPKTCDGQLLIARRVLVWYEGHQPGRPLSSMEGTHVLALVHHLMSLHSNDRTRSSTTSYLRSFLRYLQWAALSDQDLARFVPRSPCWRMAHLPPRLA